MVDDIKWQKWQQVEGDGEQISDGVWHIHYTLQTYHTVLHISHCILDTAYWSLDAVYTRFVLTKRSWGQGEASHAYTR